MYNCNVIIEDLQEKKAMIIQAKAEAGLQGNELLTKLYDLNIARLDLEISIIENVYTILN